MVYGFNKSTSYTVLVAVNAKHRSAAAQLITAYSTITLCFKESKDLLDQHLYCYRISKS